MRSWELFIFSSLSPPRSWGRGGSRLRNATRTSSSEYQVRYHEGCVHLLTPWHASHSPRAPAPRSYRETTDSELCHRRDSNPGPRPGESVALYHSAKRPDAVLGRVGACLRLFSLHIWAQVSDETNTKRATGTQRYSESEPHDGTFIFSFGLVFQITPDNLDNEKKKINK